MLIPAQDAAPRRAPEAAEREARPQELQQWRRLDWRFLLPDPRLGRVAFLGSDDGILLPALRRAAASLRLLETAPPGEWSRGGTVVGTDPVGVDPSVDPSVEKVVDLVVIRGVPWSAVERVPSLLPAGCCLYWEIDRRPGAVPRGALGRTAGFPWNPAARLAQRLAEAGFHDIETYWHRPSFESCLEMIPLHASAVLWHALSRPASGPRARARFATARALHRAGLLVPMVPCVSVLARRGGAAEVSP